MKTHYLASAWYHHLRDGGRILTHQASACFHSGRHLEMTPDWDQVTCHNCLKGRPKANPEKRND